MKETRRSGTEKIAGLWKNLTTGILDKVNLNKAIISDGKENNARDMGDTHTPISRLDLTGMNREQAKAMIGRIIDERLEMISHIEMTELKIDHREKERQRAKAAERISERRNRRRQNTAASAETVFTEQGVYSDYKYASVFDVLQPESFPFEENASAPIEGQLSMLDAITAVKKSAEVSPLTEFAPSFDMDRLIQDPTLDCEAGVPEKTADTKKLKKKTHAAAAATAAADDELFKPHGFDLFGIFPYEPADETMPEKAGAKEDPILALAAEKAFNSSLDETVDKVFAFYEKNKARLLLLCQKLQQKSAQILRGRILPAAASGLTRVNGRVTPLLMKLETRLKIKDKTAAALIVLSEREKAVSGKMVLVVDLVDRVNETFLRGVTALKDKICRLVNSSRDYVERRKRRFLTGFSAGVAVIAAITLTIGNVTAYEYVYNGKVLGVVKNQEDVYKTIDIIGDKLSVQYDADITIDKDKDIRFNKIIALDQDVDDKEDILNRLTYMRDMKANGRGIYLDGKLLAVLESEETANEILNEIQDQFVKKDPGIKYEKVGFAEDVAIKEVETKLGNIDTKEKVREYLMTGAVEKKIHVVASGETFSEIAKKYGLKQSELKASNPDVVPEKLHIGQEISLNQIVPLLTVQTTEIAQYKEAIPFEVTYENTASLYKNEQTVKSKGINGEKDVVAEIVRNNGMEVSRNELSATVLSEPVAQVVMVGTKEPPPLIGTGTFIYPMRGTLTSRYGMRWGRLHEGIDLAAPIGTDIKASDGGKVIFAGYKGQLGYLIQIDHGGGKVTWYGHCSKLFVKKGDKVYQGQHIADVGNTGRSTGPHLHFEIRINGKSKNPLNYL